MVFTIEEEEILKLIISETKARMEMNLERASMAVLANPLQIKVRDAQTELQNKFVKVK